MTDTNNYDALELVLNAIMYGIANVDENYTEDGEIIWDYVDSDVWMIAKGIASETEIEMGYEIYGNGGGSKLVKIN